MDANPILANPQAIRLIDPEENQVKPYQVVNIRLPKDLHQAILDRCAADDRTMAQLVRVAIRYYLDDLKP